MTAEKLLARSSRYLAAELGISELSHLLELLIKRLASETGTFARIALEDNIDGTERLIEGFKAELAAERRELTEGTSGAEQGALSTAEAHTLSNQYD